MTMTTGTLPGTGLGLAPELRSEPARSQAVPVETAWAQQTVASRLPVLKRARHILAARAPELAAAIASNLSRTHADTLVAEVLPFLDAIRFLERNAAGLLRARRLGRAGLPLWLSGVHAEVHRVAFGRVLVIGPSNYPLFLPGVQVFQALAAGNAVIWKPGIGGAPVARIVAEILQASGLPYGLLRITEESPEAAQDAIRFGVDKVFFTGSAATGRRLLHQLAETATPCVAELSGNDAVVVLPSADLDRVVAALSFGMRLNGSATCMAPRRVLLVDASPARRRAFVDRLTAALAAIDPVTLPRSTHDQLARMLAEAELGGAAILGDPSPGAIKPLLVLNGGPGMQIAQADIFAPVLTLIDVVGPKGVFEAQAACPLALTTSIFGDEREARELAERIPTGTVILNDLIVPTADPRVPFGGRRGSGFGVTRGTEGLLEMTAVKVISARRGRSVKHYEPTGAAHAELFGGLIAILHAGTQSGRLNGIKRVLHAARELKKK